MNNWTKISNRIKAKFTTLMYSPITDELILIIPIRFIRAESGVEYLEYADGELFGKTMTIEKAMRLEFEYVGEL